MAKLKLPPSSRASARRCAGGSAIARRRARRPIGSSRPPRSTSTASATLRRAAEVEELVDRGADRAAGIQHVVDQHDLAAVDGERDLAAAALAVQAERAEVVAVQRTAR